ncbi:MAG TPA: hypothetical protein VG722_13335, partial [Tepidisphaeraceae bacterium]|nr:hypothetical protein [Tepidisphaeraceae bacterium]
MKAFLMFRDRDFRLADTPAQTTLDLLQDLEVETLLRAMANGDKFLLEAARAAILTSLDNVAAITYRQQILTDCLKNPPVVKAIYNVAVEAIERER